MEPRAAFSYGFPEGSDSIQDEVHGKSSYRHGLRRIYWQPCRAESFAKRILCTRHRTGAVDDSLRASLGVYKWHTGGVNPDVLAAIDDVSEIYHCAGSGSVSLSLTDPRGDFSANVIATSDVLEYARQNPGVKVVIPSSASVYGAVSDLPIRIDSKHNPVSPYGVNKCIVETLCHQYGKFFGVPISLIRYFSVYGEGLRKQLLWDASRKLLQGDALFFGTGDETRDWIQVDDAAELMVLAANVASPSVTVMNGASGNAISVRDVVDKLARAMNVPGKVQFNGQVRAGDPLHYLADISQARETGWSPAISFDDGLSRYAHWLRSLGE